MRKFLILAAICGPLASGCTQQPVGVANADSSSAWQAGAVPGDSGGLWRKNRVPDGGN